MTSMKNLTACALSSLLMACGGGSTNAQQLPPVGTPQVASFKSIVFEGDSLIVNSDITTWTKEITARWQVASVNLAVAGTMTDDMLARYAVSREKFPAGPGLFILDAGTNDPRAGCNSGKTYANLKSLWKLAHDDGFRVLAFTVRSWPLDSFCESERVALNKLIKSDATLYEGLIDVDVIFPKRTNDKLLFDGTHYTPAGNLLVAVAVQEALERLK